MRKFAAVLVGLGLMALSGAAAAQTAAPAAADKAFVGAYTVIARGMEAGSFTYNFSQTGAAYEVSARRRLTGLARTLMGSNQDFDYAVRGVVADGALQPRNYQHQGGRRRDDRPNGRLVRVAFTPDSITTVATPTMGMGSPPATDAQKRGAVDQLTAIAGLITASGDPCGRTVKVYLDGRARFDFVFGASSQTTINSPAYRGPGLRCAVQYRPIAGFTEPQEAATLQFVFARTASGMWAPTHIELPTDAVGVVRLEARTLSVNGARLR